MAFNAISFEDTLTQWLTTLLGIEVIIANDEGPRPEKPFCTVNITNILKVGQDEENVVGTDLVLKGNREVGVSLQFFGTDSTVLEYADTVASALGFSLLKINLTAAEISFLSHTDTTNVDNLIESGYDKRSAISVKFAIGSRVTLAVDTIDEVNIDKTLKDAAGNTVVSDSFNVGG